MRGDQAINLPWLSLHLLRYLLQGIAEIGSGVGYACGPVIGGFLYKVLNEIVGSHTGVHNEDCAPVPYHRTSMV